MPLKRDIPPNSHSEFVLGGLGRCRFDIFLRAKVAAEMEIFESAARCAAPRPSANDQQLFLYTTHESLHTDYFAR